MIQAAFIAVQLQWKHFGQQIYSFFYFLFYLVWSTSWCAVLSDVAGSDTVLLHPPVMRQVTFIGV